MFVFEGILNFDHNAVNADFVVVVPASQTVDEQCIINFRWTLTNDGRTNVKYQSVAKFHDKRGQLEGAIPTRNFAHPEIAFYEKEDDFYWFLWNVNTNRIQMMNKYNGSCGRITGFKQVYPVSLSDP